MLKRFSEWFRRAPSGGVFGFSGSHGEFEDGVVNSVIPTKDAAREEFFNSPLMLAAVNTTVGLVLGSGVQFGFLADDRAQRVLEEWFRFNDIGDLADRALTEYALGGEMLAVMAGNAGRDESARVNLVDPEVVDVRFVEGDPDRVESVVIPGVDGRNRVVTPDLFVWRAGSRVFGESRGTGVAQRAVRDTRNHARLLELRLRQHELRGRINGVAKLFADTPEELQQKASQLNSLNRRGKLIALRKIIDASGTHSEELEFFSAKTDAADASSDVRNYVRAVGMAFSLPEHFFAIGDTGNRSTAAAMAGPVVRNAQRLQALMTGFLSELFRKELIRRFGEDELFRRDVVTVVNGKRVLRSEMVPASMLDIPFQMPSVSDGNDDVVVKRTEFALATGLVSRATAQRELGYDPVLEAELIASDPLQDAESPEVSSED